jgi:hypothetical protein
MTGTRRSPLWLSVQTLAIPAAAAVLDVHVFGTPRRVSAGR